MSVNAEVVGATVVQATAIDPNQEVTVGMAPNEAINPLIPPSSVKAVRTHLVGNIEAQWVASNAPDPATKATNGFVVTIEGQPTQLINASYDPTKPLSTTEAQVAAAVEFHLQKGAINTEQGERIVSAFLNQPDDVKRKLEMDAVQQKRTKRRERTVFPVVQAAVDYLFKK